MVFSSVLFLFVFLPAIILLYFLVPKKIKNFVLLLGSLFFYSWGGPKFSLILIGTTIFDFYLVGLMHRQGDKKRKVALLSLSLIITIGILVYYKYSNFFIENFNSVLQLLGFSAIGWTKLILPIGISFFSFQKLTYAIDVYKDKHKPLKSPFDYLLFITMFPQLIAGPIIRFNEIADQIEDRKHRVADIFSGLVRFSIGLGKKVLIANVLSEYADNVFNGSNADLSTGEAWLGLLAYTFQIYFDFSGYSDMAIGLGKVFGFSFPENFNSPYISKSITEFWRRWHITLGSWMRDYLYIPLGGNRVSSSFRLYFNLIIVFLISGLWHGASWNYVLWGAFHGMFLVLDRVFLLNILRKIGNFGSLVTTFFITMLGWVVFRIEDTANIWPFYKILFAFNFECLDFSRVNEFYTILSIALFFSVFTVFKFGRNIEAIFLGTDENLVKRYSGWLFVAGILLLILSTASITASKFNPFIYFRF